MFRFHYLIAYLPPPPRARSLSSVCCFVILFIDGLVNVRDFDIFLAFVIIYYCYFLNYFQAWWTLVVVKVVMVLS